MGKLFEPAKAGDTTQAIAVSETVAKSHCTTNKPFKWRASLPLEKGFDPVPISVVSVSNSTVKFNLVDLEAGTIVTAHTYEIDIDDLDSCHRAPPSIDVSTVTATDTIIHLLIRTTYCDSARSLEAAKKPFKDAAAEAKIDLPGGKWPKSELASQQNLLTEMAVNKVIELATSNGQVTLAQLRTVFRAVANAHPGFSLPPNL